MALRVLVLLVAILIGSGAIAEDVQANKIAGTDWFATVTTSSMTDLPKIVLAAQSTQPVTVRGRAYDVAQVIVWCEDNVTSLQIHFGGAFMSDIGGYGEITYRIDDHPPVTRRFTKSTDHQLLGLWTGSQSIPVIKSLVSASAILVRATPFDQDAVEFTVPVKGLDVALPPLRAACHW